MTSTLLTGISDGGGLVGVVARNGVDERSAEAVRRLVDPQTLLGAAPGTREAEGTRRAVVAGEIFNLVEVAEAAGLPSGASAEAVVASGYERWGRGLLDRLRGSFALAVVDEARGGGLVAADAAGAHSIFFHAASGTLFFASEIHLLLRLLPTRPGPNRVAVVHWLSYASTGPVGETLYEGVHELTGGECFELSEAGWSRSRYWAPSFEQPAPLSLSEAGELLWSAFSGAVAARLGRGEDVAVLMSGGIDSSAVAAAAVAAAPARGSTVHTYSAVFPDYPSLDDRERVDLLVETLRLRNTQARIEPSGGFSLSLDWLAAFELPLLDPAFLLDRPLLDLAAVDGTTAFLDGQGGDESFGAPVFWLADLFRAGRVLTSLRQARRLPAGGSARWRAALRAWCDYGLLGAIPPRLHRARRRHRPLDVPFLTTENARLLVETDTVWDWKKLDAPRWWAEKAYLVTADRQTGGIKSYLRLRGALAGLEARSALLDVDVIEAILRVPPQLDFDPVLDRVSFRAAMAGRVPDSVRLSPWKSDLGPFAFDGLTGGELEAVRDLFGRSAEVYAYTRPDAVRRLANERPERLDGGGRDWSVSLWRLATIESWLRSQGDPSFAEDRRRGLSAPRATVYPPG